MHLNFKMTSFVTTGNRTDRIRVFASVEEKDYVTGGVTFDLSTMNYSELPGFTLGLALKNLIFSPTTMISAVAETVSATIIKVRVTKNDGVTISEAASDDVVVYLYVVGK